MNLSSLLLYANLTVQAFPSPTREEFTYEKLLSLIGSEHVSSLEQLLPLLPAEFRSNYTLVHTSKSLQGASHQAPRVILFGYDATLTCAFNGEEAQVGFDSLECFQFRKETRTFDFRQIVFPSAYNGLSLPVFSESNVSADGKVRCSICHGADLRPNWDGYPNWPGFYGEHKDRLGDDSDAYRAFVAMRSQHPRYRYLIQDDDPSAPYFKDDPLDASRRPNFRFSDFVTRMNGLRGLRIASARFTHFELMQFASSALECKLSDGQNLEIALAGKLPYRNDDIVEGHYTGEVPPPSLYDKLGISSQIWTTRMRAPSRDFAYEFQGGVGLLRVGVAMALLGDLAKDNSSIQEAIVAVLARTLESEPPGYMEFLKALNGIYPDTNPVSTIGRQNADQMCLQLTPYVVGAYLAN